MFLTLMYAWVCATRMHDQSWGPAVEPLGTGPNPWLLCPGMGGVHMVQVVELFTPPLGTCVTPSLYVPTACP